MSVSQSINQSINQWINFILVKVTAEELGLDSTCRVFYDSNFVILRAIITATDTNTIEDSLLFVAE